MRRPDDLQRKLDEQQQQFNSFVAGELHAACPAAAKTERRGDDKSYAQIAGMIPEGPLRKRFVDEARALLEANLAVARFEATPQEPEIISRSWAGALALLAIALIWTYGPRLAFLAGAFAYWMAAETAHRRQRDENEEVREHNQGTAEAAQYVSDWEAELHELILVD